MKCFGSKYVKTKKEHKCFGCIRKFPPETEMKYITNLTDDGFFSFYMCDICLEEVETWPEWTDEGIFEGDVINNMPELFEKPK